MTQGPWNNNQVRRTFEVIACEQKEKVKEKLSYVKHAISKGHNENCLYVLIEACELLHDAIETLQMEIDQIQNQLDR